MPRALVSQEPDEFSLAARAPALRWAHGSVRAGRKEQTMEPIGHFDPYILVGLAITVFLIACVGFFGALRDWRSVPQRLVTNSVRCPQRQEAAVVTYVERRRLARPRRTVQSCSLLDVGERCSEVCAHSKV